MTTTITVDDDILDDLKLIKRVGNHKNMSETLRHIIKRAGFTVRRLEYTAERLKEFGAE